MSSSLEALPVELVEMSASFLQLDDIRSLRLTCRILKQKASKGIFTTFFAHKNVELTTKTLEDLVKWTGQDYLGRYLQYCTITGIVRRKPKKKGKKKEEIEGYSRLLAEAFGNLKRYSPSRGLTSLCLRVDATQSEAAIKAELEGRANLNQFRSWIPVWDLAMSTFNITAAALNLSELHVTQHLDIFSSLRGCSLNCDAFVPFVQKPPNSMHIFQSLKTLKLSLSAPHRNSTYRPVEERRFLIDHNIQWFYSSLTLRCLSELFRHMAGLESLDLHWYTVEDPKPARSTSSTFCCPADGGTGSQRALRLKECVLSGFYVRESELLQFLNTVRPVGLTLIYIHLVSEGPYDRIFNYLTAPDCLIAEFHLDDISYIHKLLHYENVPGQSKFPYLGDTFGPSTLTRTIGHVKRPIEYRLPRRRALGSPEISRWHRERDLEYGPPNNHQYSFTALNLPPQRVMADSASENEAVNDTSTQSADRD